MAHTDTATLKEWLKIPDTQDDLLVTKALAAAEKSIENYTGRVFNLSSTATAKRYRANNRYIVFTHDIATTTGFVLKTDDDADGVFETTWTSADYQLEPGTDTTKPYSVVRCLGGTTFPWYRDGRNGIEITAKWGWPSVPAPVEEATLLLAARLFKRQYSPEGLAGNTEFGAVRISTTDRDVRDLLDPYKRRVAR